MSLRIGRLVALMLTLWGEGGLLFLRDRQARSTDVNIVGRGACVSEGQTGS